MRKRNVIIASLAAVAMFAAPATSAFAEEPTVPDAAPASASSAEARSVTAAIDIAIPKSVDTVELTTTAGRAPAFPAEVTVHYSDGTTQQQSVTWNDSTDWTTRKLLPQPVIVTGDVDTGISGITLPALANVTIKSPFTDVNDLTPHATDIYWASGQDIAKGYADGKFGPMRNVNRQDMAAFLYRLAGSPAFTPSDADRARFKDVNPSTPHYDEILWLGHAGIAQGYEDGTFGGTRTVVRQDMASFLRRFAIYEGVQSAKDYAGPSVETRSRYVDVAGSPHEQDVWWLIDSGVAQGYSDHTFGVMRTVVRQDMAAFLHRMKTLIG